MRMLASLITTFILAAATPSAAETMTVQIDHSARVALAGSAANVFVGNASIADAMVVDRRNIVVIGRGYGVTNVMVVDGAGRTILNRQVQVTSGDAGRVTLYGGGRSMNYTCSPSCEHTPMPGENKTEFEAYNAPYQTYQSRASQGGSQTSATNGGDGGMAAVAAAAAAGAAAGVR